MQVGKFWLGLWLAMLLVAPAAPAWAAEGQRPDFDLRMAYETFPARAENEAKERMNAHLRLFALNAEDAGEVEKQRTLLVRKNYPDDFITRLDQAVELAGRLRNGDGSQAFELYKEYAQRSDGRPFPQLAMSLLWLAKRKGFPPALYLSAEQGFRSDVPRERESACLALERLADQGEVRAALTLGRRYLKGEGLAHDNERAFYWFSKTFELALQKDEELHERARDHFDAAVRALKEGIKKSLRIVAPV